MVLINNTFSSINYFVPLEAFFLLWYILKDRLVKCKVNFIICEWEKVHATWFLCPLILFPCEGSMVDSVVPEYIHECILFIASSISSMSLQWEKYTVLLLVQPSHFLPISLTFQRPPQPPQKRKQFFRTCKGNISCW